MYAWIMTTRTEITEVVAKVDMALAATLCEPTVAAQSTREPKAYDKAALIAAVKACCADRMARFIAE